MNEDWTWTKKEWKGGRWVEVKYTMDELRAMSDEDLWDFLKEVYDDGYDNGAGY